MHRAQPAVRERAQAHTRDRGLRGGLQGRHPHGHEVGEQPGPVLHVVQ